MAIEIYRQSTAVPKFKQGFCIGMMIFMKWKGTNPCSPDHKAAVLEYNFKSVDFFFTDPLVHVISLIKVNSGGPSEV